MIYISLRWACLEGWKHACSSSFHIQRSYRFEWEILIDLKVWGAHHRSSLEKGLGPNRGRPEIEPKATWGCGIESDRSDDLSARLRRPVARSIHHLIDPLTWSKNWKKSWKRSLEVRWWASNLEAGISDILLTSIVSSIHRVLWDWYIYPYKRWSPSCWAGSTAPLPPPFFLCSFGVLGRFNPIKIFFGGY